MGVTGSTTLTVTAAQLVSISVTPTNPSLAKGTTRQLTATGTFTDSSTQNLTAQVAWASTDATVATVSNAAGSEGLATAVDLGSATVSASLNGVTGSTTVTVTAAQLVSISVTPTSPSLAKGTTRQLTATGTFTDSSTQNLTAQVAWSSSDAAVATVSNAPSSEGLATAVNVGSATVSATLNGVTGSTTLTVTAAQLVSISVTPTNPSLAKGTSRQLTATGTFTDSSTQNLTAQVAWTSSDAAIATVSNATGSEGLATAVNVGSATASASLNGVTGSTTLTVTPAQLASISVTPTNPSLAKGTTRQLTATGTFTDSSTQNLTAQVAWSSSDAAIATVSNATGSEGLATAVNVGSTTVSASLNGVTGSTTLAVTAAQVVSISVTPTNPSLAKGTSRQLTATGTFTDSSMQDLTAQVAWASSDAAVATVSNAASTEGLVTAVNLGSATVSATLNGVTGSTAVTVTAAQLVSIGVTPTTPSLAKGTTRQLTATGTFTDSSTQDLTAQVAWASSDAAVATVSNATGSEGLATAVTVGSTTVSAALNGVTGSTTLTVTAAQLVSIGVTPTTPSLAKGTTRQLTATGTFTDSSTQDLTAQVAWASSDAAVAAVSNAAGSEGLVTAVNVGSTTVTATLNGVTGSTVVTVTAAQLVSIGVTPTNPLLARGTTQQLAAVGTYTDSSTQDLTTQVTWTSSDDAVATVSNAAGSHGLVTAVNVGSATMSATLDGITGSTSVTVTAAQLVSIGVTPTNPSLARGTNLQLVAVGTYSDGSTQDLTAQVAWASSDAAITTVSNAAGSQGLVTAINLGSATVSATLAGVTGSTTVTVTPAQLVAISVSPANPALAKGSTQQFAATGTYSDGSTQNLTAQAAWASSDAAIAAVSNAAGSEGLLTALNVGSVTVSATLNGVTGTTSVTVTPAQLIFITVTPANPSLPRGATQQFTATGTYSDGSAQDLTTQVTWISSDAAVAAVSNAAGSEGLATALNLGTATVTATVGAVAGSTTVTVTPAQLVSIALSPVNPSLVKGTSLQLTATGTYSDGSTQDVTTQVTWSSNNPSVATVSNAAGSQGLLTAVNTGTTIVSASLSNVTISMNVTVTAPVPTGLTVTPNSASMDRYSTLQLTATLSLSDGSTQDVTTTAGWSSSNVTVATVSNRGVVTSLTAGSVNITVTSNGFTQVVPITVSTCHVTINEVQTAGTSASDEFVELYNGCTTTIDLNGWNLFYRSQSGTTNTGLFAFTVSTPMPPGSFRLYAGIGFSGTKDGGWASGTGTLSGTSGGVGLLFSGGQIVDGVGYGGATNAFVEGTAVGAPAASKSVGRFPTDGKDTDSNSVDFHLTTSPTPRATNN